MLYDLLKFQELQVPQLFEEKLLPANIAIGEQCTSPWFITFYIGTKLEQHSGTVGKADECDLPVCSMEIFRI